MTNNNSIKTVRLIIDEVKKAVIGKDKIIIKILLAVLSRGHILLEDIPGVGKTTLALAFSKALSAWLIPPAQGTRPPESRRP